MSEYHLRLAVTRTFYANAVVEAASREDARSKAEDLNVDHLHLTTSDRGQIDVVAVLRAHSRVDLTKGAT